MEYTMTIQQGNDIATRVYATKERLVRAIDKIMLKHASSMSIEVWGEQDVQIVTDLTGV